MRKAFTLIELLVVIAIIAILAAILFPVFAQARTAAKKTVAISNQKQISLSFMMYIGDNDERYPMRSGCELRSSINPALRVPALNNPGMGCTGPFYNSMTWQTWQKYVMPYINSLEVFFHPLRQRDGNQWNTNGQIQNGFAINLAITGAAVTAFTSTPWTGGTQSGIANPAAANLLLEMPNTFAVPFVVQTGGPPAQTVYPMAIREYWQRVFFRTTGGNHCTLATPLTKDSVGVGPADGVVVGFADGSAKFVSTDRFLSLTPTNQEYLPGTTFPASSAFTDAAFGGCRRQRSAYDYSGGPSVPRIDINYPFWGLGN